MKELVAIYLALAIAKLRYHREEGQGEGFEALHGRLGRISDVMPDVRARLCYERCLFAFQVMNNEAAIRALGEWPDKTHDVFWDIRKAAVLAELGHTDQAIPIAESSLASLRKGLLEITDHVPALSREGWAMWLVKALRSNQRLRERVGWGLADSAQFSRRLNQLKKYGCSPGEIIDHFNSLLDQPAPQPREQVETRPGFEPGTFSQTFHLDTSFGTKLLTAYQYFRLVEEAAHPPGFGQIILSKDKLKQAAEWFTEHDPVRTRSLMIRLCDAKLIEHYLSRHRVAALSPAVIDQLRAIARGGIEQALSRLRASFRPESEEELRASRQLECAIELLSRVCIRELEDRLGDLWGLACRLYKEPVIRTGISFDRPVGHLFENLVNSTPPTQLAGRLPVLFRLPLPGEPDFSVSMPDHWPDPSVLAARQFSSPIWQRAPAGWGDAKTRLFNLARANDTVTRRLAVFRLVELNDLGVLSVSDRRRLAEVFWTPAGEAPSLPFEAWGPSTPWLALTLPEPRGIEVYDRVRQHILSGQPGAVHGGMVHPGGYFDLVLFATKPAGNGRQPSPNRRYISWSSSDIRQLFEVIRSWWITHGRRIADEIRGTNRRWGFDRAAVRLFMNLFWDVMRVLNYPGNEAAPASGRHHHGSD